MMYPGVMEEGSPVLSTLSTKDCLVVEVIYANRDCEAEVYIKIGRRTLM